MITVVDDRRIEGIIAEARTASTQEARQIAIERLQKAARRLNAAANDIFNEYRLVRNKSRDEEADR